MSPLGRYILKNAVVDRRGMLVLPFFAFPNIDADSIAIRRLHVAILQHVATLNRMSSVS